MSIDIRIEHPFRNQTTIKSANIDTDPQNSLGRNESNKSIFTIDDYKWNNGQYLNKNNTSQKNDTTETEDEIFTEFRKPVYLEITEFQPVLVLAWLKEVNKFVQGIKGTVSAARNTVQSAGNLATNTFNGNINGPQDIINAFLLESSNISNIHQQTLVTPVDLIKQMFQGSYVAKYEVPYSSKTVYRADGARGWDSKKDDKETVGFVQELYSIVQKQIPIDYPMMPEWKYDGNITTPEVETTFMLYNDSYINLRRNFRFLHAFIAGSFWEQIDYIQRPPNVYNVHFPGYFEYFYCTAEIEVETVGNMRKLYDNKSALGLLPNNPSIIDAFFPDAYKVTVKFQSMVPNNYNLYLRYLLQGKDSNVQVGNVEMGLVSKIATDSYNAVTK